MKTIIIKTVCMFALVALVAGNSWSQNAEQLFQKGIMKEEGEGSLREAIELYKSVADNTNADKVLRAKALYQMGSCYEKLGQQEARNVYEKLVANYTDPQELVANAKRKLSKMNVDQSVSDNSGISIRQITDDGGNTSPDGKFMLIHDGENAILNVKEKKIGNMWSVSPKGTWGREVGYEMHYPGEAIWSSDSKKVAYEWNSQGRNSGKVNWSSELHIVDRDGTNDHIIRRDTTYSWVTDWSPDGNNLLYKQSGDSSKLILISLKDGKEKVIASLPDRRYITYGHFTNDGNFVVFNAHEPKSGSKNIYSVSVNGGEINELITFPEAEGTPWAIPNSNQVIFISNHSGTNDLWSMNIEKGRLIGEPRILKSGLDETSEITGVLDNGTVLYSSNRLNPDFFYAKLDFNKNDLLIHPFRNSFGKIFKTIWSPSLSKVAVLVAKSYTSPGSIKIKMIGYDLKTSEKNEISTDNLITFPSVFWIVPQWTPDEKSVLIKAGTMGGDPPGGIYKFNFSSGKVEEYMTKDHTWSALQWQWLQFSPDGKIQYFGSLDNNFLYPLKIIARTVETGEERTITQFDKEIKKFFLSPDGKSIAVKYENVLLIVPVDGNSETKKIECPDDKWGTVLGWSNDSKSVLLQKPVGKEAWAIWNQPLDGQEPKELIPADKLKPFFGASDLLLHYIGDETFLSMQHGKQIYELWAVENIVQK